VRALADLREGRTLRRGTTGPQYTKSASSLFGGSPLSSVSADLGQRLRRARLTPRAQLPPRLETEGVTMRGTSEISSVLSQGDHTARSPCSSPAHSARSGTHFRILGLGNSSCNSLGNSSARSAMSPGFRAYFDKSASRSRTSISSASSAEGSPSRARGGLAQASSRGSSTPTVASTTTSITLSPRV